MDSASDRRCNICGCGSAVQLDLIGLQRPSEMIVVFLTLSMLAQGGGGGGARVLWFVALTDVASLATWLFQVPRQATQEYGLV